MINNCINNEMEQQCYICLNENFENNYNKSDLITCDNTKCQGRAHKQCLLKYNIINKKKNINCHVCKIGNYEENKEHIINIINIDKEKRVRDPGELTFLDYIIQNLCCLLIFKPFAFLFIALLIVIALATIIIAAAMVYGIIIYLIFDHDPDSSSKLNYEKCLTYGLFVYLVIFILLGIVLLCDKEKKVWKIFTRRLR